MLAQLLTAAPVSDPRVIIRPGIGLDCAVVDVGDRYLVFKSDPITFATDNIGWYLVQVNGNDIATTGGLPRWLMVTMLLPEGQTDEQSVTAISEQLFAACQEYDISLIGGHTEITHGLDRPILSGTLIGEVAKDKLITPQGLRPGDRILLTKGVPIEATAVLAREFPDKLQDYLSDTELAAAQNFLFEPGISILRDAQIAISSGQVTAMHDPTEGGLAGALWELAEAANLTLSVNPAAVPVPELAKRVCQIFGLDPLATIASGALLLAATASDTPAIVTALSDAGIRVAEIGEVVMGEMNVIQPDGSLLPRPARDEIARLYESLA